MARSEVAALPGGGAAGLRHLETAPAIRIVKGPGPWPPSSPRGI
ncbi:hypothetical protein [Kitasatospora sp. NRRL B-11411]|nr:hypothetical protein [Kitasatospora sp. NRRL B-11411]